jgi:phage FluMu gp28-like protein
MGLFQAVCRVTKKTYSAAAELAWRTKIFDDYGDHAEEELLCVPSSSSGVFLSSVLIESRTSADVPVVRWECPYTFLERGNAALFKDAEDFCLAKLKPLLSRINPDLMSCLGEDFGRSGDLTVIWPLQLGKMLMRRTPFVLELRNVPFKQQEQILFYIVDHLPRFIGGAMDARGNGQYLAETAQLRYGSRVEAVMLSQEWYRDNMPRYKAAFEDANIELPKDADILADHRMLRMEKGIVKIPERRTRCDDGRQRHGDSAIAGALAWFASQTNQHEYAYTPATSLISRKVDDGPPDDDDDAPRGRSGFFRSRIRFGRGAY